MTKLIVRKELWLLSVLSNLLMRRETQGKGKGKGEIKSYCHIDRRLNLPS